jgi:DNA-binding transcriptional ArsR family regulator
MRHLLNHYGENEKTKYDLKVACTAIIELLGRGESMARKPASKRQSAKRTPKAVTTKKPAVKPRSTSSAGKSTKTTRRTATRAKSTKQTTKKAILDLLAKGKKQGYLTYDEINEMLPEDMLSPEQIDETFMMFDDNEIQIIDQKKKKSVVKLKKTKEKKVKRTEARDSDFGTVTDPVKMYLREMGLVTLLSREGEVEIAKKIEAGEQEVLRALLETTAGVVNIIDLGNEIESGAIRPKYVLRDIDEGDTYVDEMMQFMKKAKNFETDSFQRTWTRMNSVDSDAASLVERIKFLICSKTGVLNPVLSMKLKASFVSRLTGLMQ